MMIGNLIYICDAFWRYQLIVVSLSYGKVQIKREIMSEYTKGQEDLIKHIKDRIIVITMEKQSETDLMLDIVNLLTRLEPIEEL